VSPLWAAGCPVLRRGLARLQASESVLGSLLSREAQRSLVWLQASESVLCSRLSGEVPWVAVASVVYGLVECDVVLHLAEDPVVVPAPLWFKVECCRVVRRGRWSPIYVVVPDRHMVCSLSGSPIYVGLFGMTITVNTYNNIYLVLGVLQQGVVNLSFTCRGLI
jgi:hypothetical protein